MEGAERTTTERPIERRRHEKTDLVRLAKIISMQVVTKLTSMFHNGVYVLSNPYVLDHQSCVLSLS
jgi:hypothetical protein